MTNHLQGTMSNPELENRIEVAILTCGELAKTVKACVVKKEGVKFTSLATPRGNTPFSVASLTNQLVVAPKLDGSIEFYCRGAWLEPEKFFPSVDGSRISMTHRGKTLTVEEATDLLLNPFFHSSVN
ncbi:MAG: hypothetical protein AABO41_05100 [Acidobacteriota bacterium]